MMAMNADEAKAEILKRVVVTRQHVTLAKSFLQRLPGIGPHDPFTLMNQFSRQQGYQHPEKIVLHPSVNPEPLLRQTSGYFTCVLALAEGIWALIHQGYLLHVGNLRAWEAHQEWTTVVPGQGGMSAGWRFPEYTVELPQKIVLAPSYRHECPQPMTDPDLFVLEAGIENADPEIIEALQDAVCCFRHELYRPAVTMLGKAMEGAWIELGCSLARAVPTEGGFNKEKFMGTMSDDNIGIATKIQKVRNLYNQKNLVAHVVKQCGISPKELDNIIIWSDVLRESRNAIHFGVKPTIENSYEKVAVLFIDGAKNLAIMYKIKRIADELPAKI
jgi:hypothetical protein